MTLILYSRCVIIICYVAFAINIEAQSGYTFSDIENKIRVSDNADSINYYLKLGARLARERDHINNWVSYTLEYLGRDNNDLRIFNERKLFRLWREPANPEESSAVYTFYSGMGYYYYRGGDIELSVQYYELAISMFNRYGIADADLLEEVLKPLGNHYLRLGDFDKATAVHYRMHDWVSQRSDPNAEASTYNFLGLLQKLKGEHVRAIRSFEQGMAIHHADPAIHGKIASNLSLLWSESGNDIRAEQYAKDAISYLKRLPSRTPDAHEDLARTLMIVAQIRLNQREVASANELINSAIGMAPYTDRRTLAKMLVIRGRILGMAGYHEEAVDDFNAAMFQLVPEFSPENRYENPIMENLPAENTIFEALEGKADAYVDLFHETNAITSLDHALDCHQRALETELLLRKQLSTEFSRNVISADSKRRNSKALAILAQMQRHSPRQEYAREAFRIMEAGKANSVLESIYLRLQDSENSGVDSLIGQLQDRIRGLERDFTYLKLNISSSDQVKSLERELHQSKLLLAETRAKRLSQFGSYAEVLDTRVMNPDPDITDVLRDSGQLLVEYFLHENSGYAVVVSRDGSVVFKELQDVDHINSVAVQLVSTLHSRSAVNTETFGELAQWLYQLLIADVVGDLSGLTSVIIVPDGILNYLPFEALVSHYDPAMRYADMPYLLREVSIHYGHSMAVLSLQQRIQSQARTGIAFAPFIHGRRGLDALTYSGDEINATNIFGLRKFMNKEASFGNFILHATKSRIIHLATHAGVDSAGIGRIEFADSSMLLSDVYYLPLGCDLAILSACESAFGVNVPAEGIQNFSRVFAMAGTSTILASHWRLNDASGAEMIGSFYKYLRQGLKQSSALRQAKLDYLAKADIPEMRKSPHYWASMVMFGSDREMTIASEEIHWYVIAGLLILLGVTGLLVFQKANLGIKK